MGLANAALSALVNLLVLAGLPFGAYVAYHRWRHHRTFRESARRAGLQRAPWRDVAFAGAFALACVALLTVWPPPLEPFLRAGSPQRPFVGLGLGLPSVTLALLYGVVQTGFAEELLFRGLIAGSLARRLPLLWANLLQALIFLLPHLLVLTVMPELWGLLPLIFVGALLWGGMRVRSGSILGPWLMHASANVAVCLSVALRTAA